jgi:predicted ATPase
MTAQLSADNAPDPTTASSPAEFMDALRRLKVWAGDPSFEQLSRRCGVPASTLSDAVNLRRARLPSLEVAKRFVRACGGKPSEIAGWEAKWRALRDRPGAAAGQHPDSRGTPHQLPPDVPNFVGRQRELRLLDAARHGGHRAILVVGAPGIGKTAMAVHWAHRVAEDYPDGQLFLDLSGFARKPPLSPAQALHLLLGALGLPADRVPVGVPARLALYRSLTYTRRVLVVLDNVRDAEQVRHLLPGGPGCVTLVTSRHRLTGVVARDGAHQLALGPLLPGEAVGLLNDLLGAEETLRARPGAVHELARLCDHHPLALRVAAANFNDRPYGSIPQYISMLLAGDRLVGLQATDDDHAAVSTAYDLSYVVLGSPVQHLFRRLAALSGAEFTADDAAFLSGSPTAQVIPQLNTLIAAHLVEVVAPDRFRLGTLPQLYAAARHRADDPSEAYALGDIPPRRCPRTRFRTPVSPGRPAG